MDLLGTGQVDPIHQSPQTRAYGFFAKGTVPSSLIFTHLVSFVFLTIFAGCLPRPPLVAARSVTRLSPRFRYYSAVRLSARATSTLLINALLSAHFLISDPPRSAPLGEHFAIP